MKQLLILSGKGGTGKTTVAAAFIKLSNTSSFADCDVDAPNLHLVMKQETVPDVKSFLGMDKYTIDQDLCIGCGLCYTSCRYDAIYVKENKYVIDDISCEGCSVCEYVCPADAVSSKTNIAGDLLLYKSDKVFSTGRLATGGGNSGLLVTEVKKALGRRKEEGIEIIDGSPGIGCPVLASMSGANLVLLVTEPTLSGFSDMKRIATTAKKLHIKTAVCINKVTSDLDNVNQIKEYCYNEEIPVVGEIPYDKEVVTNINKGMSIVDTQCIAGEAVKKIYGNVLDLMM
ncbi:MAG: ATP-binding protein [Bacilli bacterium]|nr:ATP-binding protein [Bacilli bacterium]